MNTHQTLAALGLTVLAALGAAQASDQSYDLYLHTLDAGHAVDAGQRPQPLKQDEAYRVYQHTLDSGVALKDFPAAAPSSAVVPSLQEHRPAIASPSHDARAE